MFGKITIRGPHQLYHASPSSRLYTYRLDNSSTTSSMQNLTNEDGDNSLRNTHNEKMSPHTFGTSGCDSSASTSKSSSNETAGVSYLRRMAASKIKKAKSYRVDLNSGRHWPEDAWRGGFGPRISWDEDSWRGGFGPRVDWTVDPGCGM